MALMIRLHLILLGAWRHRYMIVIMTLTLPLLGLAVALLSPKQYTNHTSMLIQETAKMNPFLEDFAVSAMLKERISALQTLLHSRHILLSVAEKRGMIDENTSPAEQDYLVQRLSGQLSASMMGKDLIRIDYKASEPQGMKETLEVIAEAFIEQVLAPERSSMTDSSQFLAKHVNLQRQELEQAEQALAQFKAEHTNATPELHLSTLTRIEQLKQKRSEKSAELAGVEKGLGNLDQQLSQTNPILGQIEQQIVELRAQLAMDRAKYKEGHSKIQGTQRNLNRLDQQRTVVLSALEQPLSTEQLWDLAAKWTSSDPNSQPLLISQLRQIQDERYRVDALSEEINSLDSMIDELEQQATAYGPHEQTLLGLERDLEVKRDLYQDLLSRYEMARVTGSLGLFEQEKRVKIIDRPYTPNVPSNLPPVVFVIAGVFAGLFLSAGLAVIFEITNSRIRRKAQLEQLTGVPVLARLAKSNTTT